MAEAKRIVIQGFYGYRNLGDEAILEAILTYMFNPARMHVSILSRRSVDKPGVTSLKYPGKRQFFRNLTHLLKSNIFILGGGGILKDFGPDAGSLSGWLKYLKLAAGLRRQTMLLAVGVENILHRESKTELREALNRVDLVTVRDGYSREILHSLGVKGDILLLPDPALLLGGNRRRLRSEPSDPVRVTVCLRHWYSSSFEISRPERLQQVLVSLAEVCDHLLDHYDAFIEFIPLRGVPHDDDRVVAREVVKRMKFGSRVHLLETVPTVAELMLRLDQTSLVLGMRLHALILSASLGVPVIGLGYMEKVTAFMAAIKQSPFCLGMDDVGPAVLLDLIGFVLNEYSKRSIEIVDCVEALEKDIDSGIRLLFRRFNLGDPEELNGISR